MQSKGYAFLLVVLGLAILSGWLYTQRPYQFGLDVEGGVRLTYRIKTEEMTAEQRQNLPTIASNLTRILTDRVSSALGVVEGSVQRKGNEEFIVELPGFTNADQARETLSSTASIKVYHAKNVATERMSFRKYVRAGQEQIGGATVELFALRNSTSGEALRPSDKEYQEMIKGWDLILEGDDLARASGRQETADRVVPTFEFSPDGARKLEAWSRRVLNRGEQMAFVLDGRVLSIAPLKDGAILGREAFIDGTFEPSYVANLAKLLNAGALPVSLEETSAQSVDPTIGRQALDMIVKAGMASFVVIALFLLAYYAFPGLVALVALLLYVLFTITAMKFMGATFSLAAIAGFILSVGMAVDANILVFERVKEELRTGKTLMTSVELGFKRALPAIIDSNACTILTSLVLVNLGTGAVKGFASTLILGVIISLFTAFAVTRSLLVFLVGSGLGNSDKAFALNRQWFGEGLEANAQHKRLRIVEHSRRYFLISLATIIPGLIFMGMGGLKANVEFTGGIEATYQLPASLTANQIQSNLERAGYIGPNVKITSVGGVRYASVTVRANAGLRLDDSASYQQLAQQAGGLTPLEKPTLSSVGPSVSAETLRNAILSVIISSLLIVGYLTIRFGISLGGLKNGFMFGLSAIGALVHDVFVVLGVAAIVGYFAGWEISSLFITAMLTVIGFSVHDTIVIFDRIRENLRRPLSNDDFGILCDRSITQSFARSINTSLTVIVTLLILIFAGTATIDLKFFCLAMLVGILSGTYSSIFNAAPILYLWDRARVRRRGESAGLIAETTAEMNRLRAQALAVNAGPVVGDVSGAAAARGYGQVKRRDSAIDRSKQTLDDE